MIKNVIISAICLIGLCIGPGCNELSSKKRQVKEGDILLASVEGREMYLSDVKEMITASAPEAFNLRIDRFFNSYLSGVLL